MRVCGKYRRSRHCLHFRVRTSYLCDTAHCIGHHNSNMHLPIFWTIPRFSEFRGFQVWQNQAWVRRLWSLLPPKSKSGQRRRGQDSAICREERNIWNDHWTSWKPQLAEETEGRGMRVPQVWGKTAQMLNIRYQTDCVPTLSAHSLGYASKSRPTMSWAEQNRRSYLQRALGNSECGIIR